MKVRPNSYFTNIYALIYAGRNTSENSMLGWTETRTRRLARENLYGTSNDICLTNISALENDASVPNVPSRKLLGSSSRDSLPYIASRDNREKDSVLSSS